MAVKAASATWVTSIAMVVTEVAWYQQRLDHFLTYLPAVVLREPKLAEMEQALKDMSSFSRDNAKEMLSMANQLATWGATLPEGHATKLVELYSTKAWESCTAWLQDPGVTPEEQCTVELERLLVERSILDSLNEVLPQLQAKVREAKSRSLQDRYWQQVAGLANKVLEMANKAEEDKAKLEDLFFLHNSTSWASILGRCMSPPLCLKPLQLH